MRAQLNPSAATPLRLGVAGLGRAFTLMLPTLLAHPHLRMVAACDPRPEARERFARDLGGRVHEDVAALCDDAGVDAVYLATPHQFHAEHVRLAARAGKHVLVEKPMALTISESEAMIADARAAGVVLVVGHSHSFDAPVLRARALVESGAYGAPRMLTALNYTDFLYRPRRPEELDTRQGGGVVFSQGAHQIDVARLLCGGKVRSVRAECGRWDPARPTESAYAAQLVFEDGAFASLVYSGHAHFDSDEMLGWVGEMGTPKDPAQYGVARQRLAGMAPEAEAALKRQRTYGATGVANGAPSAHAHFGVVILTCERADLRPLPTGVMIHADERQWLDPLPAPAIPRAEVIDEFCDAIAGRRPATHSGEWSLATLEVCLAILDSARTHADVALRHQVAPV